MFISDIKIITMSFSWINMCVISERTKKATKACTLLGAYGP